MKLGDLKKVIDAKTRLDELSAQREKYTAAKQLIVAYCNTGNYDMILGDYEEPSEIGRTFRVIQREMIKLIDWQILAQKRELEKLGVEL